MSEQTNMNLELIQKRLEKAKGPTYWRSLDELAATDGFKDYLFREFPRQAGEWLDDDGPSELLGQPHRIIRIDDNSPLCDGNAECRPKPFCKGLIGGCLLGQKACRIHRSLANTTRINPFPKLNSTFVV